MGSASMQWNKRDVCVTASTVGTAAWAEDLGDGGPTRGWLNKYGTADNMSDDREINMSPLTIGAAPEEGVAVVVVVVVVKQWLRKSRLQTRALAVNRGIDGQ